MAPGSLQYVYRWRIGQWSTLAPCIEHNSPPFDADGLCWVFKLFKGRTRNPRDLALYLAVHESTTDRLLPMRKKVDVSFTLENLRARSIDYNKYTTPITVWFDSTYSTWGDDKFIGLTDMESFLKDDTTCLVVRFHVRETVHEGPLLPTAQPSPAIAVYVPEKISAPFNQLLRSARFSDIQFELRDSSALLLSPGPGTDESKTTTGHASKQGLLSPRNSGDFQSSESSSSHNDALRISYESIDSVLASQQQPSPPGSSPIAGRRSPCITPMPGNCSPRPMPYAQRPHAGGSKGPPAGPRYHAHKAILMAVSPVFEAMFSNGMRETYEKVVEVWDVTPRAFERLLEYAYTRKCDLDPRQQTGPPSSQNNRRNTDTLEDSVSADEVVETLLCADQFEVSGLRDICWRNLMSRLKADTVWDIWSIATELEAREQQRVCKNYCCRHFTELCYSPATMWTPAHLLREVIASDALNVLSEELLFETIIKWASFNEDSDPYEQQQQQRENVNSYCAEKYVTRASEGINDEAVLRCYRSPSNLSLLPPRSPWMQNNNNNNRRWSANARRRPELTREAYTTASAANTRPPSSSSANEPNASSLQAQGHNNGSDVPQSPRYSVISSTKLQSSKEFSPTEPPKMSKMSSSSSSIYTSPFERKEFLVTLLPCVRFPMMDKEFLLRVVERNTDLMAIPLMKDLLIEAYRFHAFNPAIPQQQPLVQQKANHSHIAADSGYTSNGIQQHHNRSTVANQSSTSNRRASECYAKREFAPQYAKIIFPLNNTDDLTLSRSQRRKRVQKLSSIQNVNFS